MNIVFVVLATHLAVTSSASLFEDASSEVKAERRRKLGQLFEGTLRLLKLSPPQPPQHGQPLADSTAHKSDQDKPSENFDIFDSTSIRKTLGKKLLNVGSLMAGTVGLFFGPLGPIVSAMIAPYVADLIYNLKTNRKAHLVLALSAPCVHHVLEHRSTGSGEGRLLEKEINRDADGE